MSIEHIISMLVTLKEYPDSSLTLTFNDKDNIPKISVSYLNNNYEMTDLINGDTKRFVEIESLITVIDKTIEMFDKKPLIN